MKTNLSKLISYLESHQVPNWRSEVDHPHSILPDVFPEKFKLLSDGSLAYAQLFVATDTVRLYQWAAPVVAIAATSAVDPRWWPLMVVVTLFNPLRGDGV